MAGTKEFNSSGKEMYGKIFHCSCHLTWRRANPLLHSRYALPESCPQASYLLKGLTVSICSQPILYKILRKRVRVSDLTWDSISHNWPLSLPISGADRHPFRGGGGRCGRTQNAALLFVREHRQPDESYGNDWVTRPGQHHRTHVQVKPSGTC